MVAIRRNSMLKERSVYKQEKYRELRSGIKQLYPNHRIIQVNIVFDFLSNYHLNLKAEIQENITASQEEANYLLLKSQKWIISQNAEIVKHFYTYTE